MGNSKREIFICLGLALVTVALFWPVHHHGFVSLDDPVHITDNPHIRTGLTLENVKWAFSDRPGQYWRPLSLLALMLKCELFGLNAGAHHLSSLLFHLTNTLVLFWVLNRMTGARWRSAFVAALFAWHPLHVEPVAWATDFETLFSGLFWMLAFWAYARYAQNSEFRIQNSEFRTGATRNPQPATRFYWLALFFFTCGLMSKPTIVTLPCVLLLLDYWPLRRFEIPFFNATPRTFRPQLSTLRRLFLEKLPFFVLSTISVVTTYYGKQRIGVVSAGNVAPPNFPVGNVLVDYFRYLRRTFWPDDLAVFYPPVEMRPLWMVIGAGLFLTAVSILVAGSVRRRPYLLVGWLWFVGTLVPVIGLVQVGAGSVADRYAYVPLIGLFVMLAWGVPELVSRWTFRRGALVLCAVIALGACIVGTTEQLGHWQSSFKLFEQAVAVTENNYVAHSKLGEELLGQGKLDAALSHFTTALRIFPDYAEAVGNVGNVLLTQGKIEEAMVRFTEVARLRPNLPEAEYNLGLALAELGKLDEAAVHYNKALQIRPDHAQAHKGLGMVLAKQGKLPEAITHLGEAVRLKPDYPEAHLNLGRVLFEQGRLEQAVPHYATAFGINLRAGGEDEQIGLALVKAGRLKEAGAFFERALQGGTNAASSHYNLGHALMLQGKTAEGIAHYREALRLQPEFPEALNDLAWILATHKEAAVRNGTEAVRLAERAARLTKYNDAPTLDTLAAAYAEAGRFADAIKVAQDAMDDAQTEGRNDMASQLRGHLQLYQSQRPLRE